MLISYASISNLTNWNHFGLKQANHCQKEWRAALLKDIIRFRVIPKNMREKRLLIFKHIVLRKAQLNGKMIIFLNLEFLLTKFLKMANLIAETKKIQWEVYLYYGSEKILN